MITYKLIIVSSILLNYYGKGKKLKLCNKNKIGNTKILVFILKIIPFKKIDERVDFFEKIKKYYAIENNET